MWWIPSLNGWAVWNETQHRWQLDSLKQDSSNWGAAVSVAMEFLESIGETMGGFDSQLLSRSIIRDMLELAKPAMYLAYSEFDQEPNLFGVMNGVIDLQTGELRDGVSDDMVLTRSQIKYDPKADCSLWLNFLDQATGKDQDLIKFLQLFFGYSLLGVSDPEWFVLMQGPGGSGKGTFGTSLCRAMGDYALVPSGEAFQKQRGSQIREDLIHFEGKRLIAALELPDGATIDHRVIKSLTGGDPIRTRGLFKESREITQTWSLVAACNQLPLVGAQRGRVDSGWWRRVVVIPFHHVPRISDPNLKRALLNKKTGSPQVLRWLVEGCLEARRRPDWFHKLPQVVKEATASYRINADHSSAWLGECFTRKVRTFTSFVALRLDYRRFCRSLNIPKHKRLGEDDLKELLRMEGFRAARGYGKGSTQKRGFVGPGLVAESRRVALTDFVESDVAGDEVHFD